jgi:tellurite resistance protein
MIQLKEERLVRLRDRLRAKGQRPSMLLSPGMNINTKGAQDLIEAASIVEEWGAFVEAMYLMMAVDKRVLNIEREVLRGALHVLSDDRVRTTHMEAMLDAAARKVAEEGADKRLAKVVEVLKEDRDRAELTIVLAAAVAAADARVVPEEHELLTKLCKGLDIDEARANEILRELDDELAKRKSSP